MKRILLYYLIQLTALISKLISSHARVKDVVERVFRLCQKNKVVNNQFKVVLIAPLKSTLNYSLRYKDVQLLMDIV